MITNPNIQAVTAFAPATCANVAVGFDILGFSFPIVGDYVTVSKREDNHIIIEAIHSQEALPTDPEKNTASVVIQQFCRELGIKNGFSLTIQKHIPLSSGMGGSAASAVAALVACNAFLSSPLPTQDLVPYAALGEAVASGQAHPDNVVPCLYGGLTLIQSTNPLEIVSLPIPDIFCVLVHPHVQVSTAEARKTLRPNLPLKDYVKQSANLAGFIASLYRNDLRLLQRSLIDVLIEPQRAKFVPGFYQIKEAALNAGALGVSFSGSGPSIFAFAKSKKEAENIGNAMQAVLKNENIESHLWIAPISKKAAHVVEAR